ncbi:cysteine desulfurase family protein [Paenibacillus glycanilyticus]|uniref:cysteine desulfurase n=1 Tax=Paenibacillus glycanilyticus TaxID=126569 RepID=A0ABQ6GKL6_9BACL|nr:cysteine desulfurase family protein [Paenibacillus glycanilyticus]GLX70600.1 cysteine desulfurase [Paenibacillus glycanilyticus]
MRTFNNIYLDYNASTPIAGEVLNEMLPYFREHYGNPSSSHWASDSLKAAIEQARSRVASAIGASPGEVIFTSGGTEANNHALQGVYWAAKQKGNHIITTTVEHPAILNPCAFLESLGAEVTYVEVDRLGRVSPDAIKRAIRKDTILISVMHANSEVGTFQPIEEIAVIAKQYGILMHTDAAQTFGKIPVDVNMLGVDLLSIAGHKLYAPKGVGALYVRNGTKLTSFMHGAGHESGRRAGTENVPYIVGLGKAAELAADYARTNEMHLLKNALREGLLSLFGDKVRFNGDLERSLPNTLHISFLGMVGQDILDQLPEIAASTGSACHSGSYALSPVLRAMGLNEYEGLGAIRFSLGRLTTIQDIKNVIALFQERLGLIK